MCLWRLEAPLNREWVCLRLCVPKAWALTWCSNHFSSSGYSLHRWYKIKILHLHTSSSSPLLFVFYSQRIPLIKIWQIESLSKWIPLWVWKRVIAYPQLHTCYLLLRSETQRVEAMCSLELQANSTILHVCVIYSPTRTTAEHYSWRYSGSPAHFPLCIIAFTPKYLTANTYIDVFSFGQRQTPSLFICTFSPNTTGFFSPSALFFCHPDYHQKKMTHELVS